MKKHFDDVTIKSLKPGGKPYDCMADKEPGFGIRVHPTGTKTFFYQYKVAGQRRFIALGSGSYPATSLKAARDEYEQKRGQVKALRKGSRDGVDPVIEKKNATARLKAEEQERRQQYTFDELAKEYIQENVTGHVVARSEYDIKRVLLGTGKKGCVDDFKEWRNRKANSISHEEAAALLKAVSKRSAASARNLIKTARPMFVYGLARGIVAANPFEMQRVKTFLPKATKAELKPTVKNRVLAEEEIRTVWKGLGGNCHGSTEACDALRLMLLLGQRPTEVLGLDSKEITGNWWTLPKERTKTRLDKNRRDHAVYLVPEALALIGDRKGKVFDYTASTDKENGEKTKAAKGKTDEERGHISINAIGRMIRRNNYFGLEPWGAHDLRRTVRTFMSDIDGISTRAAEAVLNHAQEGVKKNYDHHRYLRQIEQALTLWRDKLVEIIGEPLIKQLPENVISIEGRRKTA